MKRTLALSIATLLCFCCGCANEPVAPVDAVATAAPGQQEQQDEDASSIGDKMADLVEKAKGKTPSLNDVKKMFNDAGDATGQGADDAMNWANEMYKSLSERGMTTTGNVQDWISEDWNNINAWEYQVVTVDSKQIADNPGVLAEKLNEAGKQRWDCFHVSDGASGTRFYMKRQKKSYMKNLPLKDMLKLIPLLDSE